MFAFGQIQAKREKSKRFGRGQISEMVKIRVIEMVKIGWIWFGRGQILSFLCFASGQIPENNEK